jgi:hypothetical protein
MKTGSLLIKYALGILMLIFGVLGAQMASVINRNNTSLGGGILGLVVLYLAYREFSASRNNISFDALFGFPKNIKYFVLMLISSLVAYLALGKILEMILSLA